MEHLNNYRYFSITCEIIWAARTVWNIVASSTHQLLFNILRVWIITLNEVKLDPVEHRAYCRDTSDSKAHQLYALVHTMFNHLYWLVLVHFWKICLRGRLDNFFIWGGPPGPEGRALFLRECQFWRNFVKTDNTENFCTLYKPIFVLFKPILVKT